MGWRVFLSDDKPEIRDQRSAYASRFTFHVLPGRVDGGRRRDGEMESRPGSWRVLGPQPAAVGDHPPLGHAQAQADSPGLAAIARIDAVERLAHMGQRG